MGARAKPLRDRILAALDQAGRPLTFSELKNWFFTKDRRSDLRAEVDRMVAGCELVDLGDEPPRPRDPCPHPRRLYGPARRKGDRSRWAP